jgi:AbrB family looped-hinge helix DNA binding protein
MAKELLSLLEVKLLYLDGDMVLDMAKGVTISSKGQITLPKELREKYHLMEGEEALILDAGDGILLKHGRTNLRGIFKGKMDSKGIEEDLRKLRKEWSL